MQTLLNRSLICFAALLVSWQASAQTSMTRAQLEANINTKVTTNGHGELTGAILNSVLQNMAASTTTLLDPIAANSVICNSSGSSAAPAACTTLPSGLTIPSPILTGTAEISSLISSGSSESITINTLTQSDVGGPNIILYNNSGGSGAGGSIIYNNNNSSGVFKTAAFVNGGLVDATAGSERGLIDFEVFDGTNNKNRILTETIAPGAASANFTPSDDDYWTLGIASLRYANVYSYLGNFAGTTASASTTTGAIIDAGGLGVAGDGFFGASVNAGTVFKAPLTTWADNQTCSAGQFVMDAGFLYVCTATNTVKRAALSTF